MAKTNATKTGSAPDQFDVEIIRSDLRSEVLTLEGMFRGERIAVELKATDWVRIKNAGIFIENFLSHHKGERR